VDARQENIAEAARRLPEWAGQNGRVCRRDGDTLILGKMAVHLRAEDAFAFAEDAAGETWDLIIASAFLDLAHLPTALPALFRRLEPGGLFYFTITFDGVTAFEPPLAPGLDEQIEALYHADMDARRVGDLPTGGSRAGRALLRELLAAGALILAAGSSGWVVYPDSSGRYPADEAFFLHFILQTIEGALAGHPDLDPEAFAGWIAARRAQVEAGRLVYIAHQLDVLGQPPARPIDTQETDVDQEGTDR
jgi:hypothetical protein